MGIIMLTLEIIMGIIIYALVGWIGICGANIGFIETFKRLAKLNKPTNNPSTHHKIQRNKHPKLFKE